MSSKKINKKNLEKKYKDACSQGHCPSLAERKNDKIIELAKGLQTDSKKETLANIAEWQNNNVVYWFERNMAPKLEALGFIFVVILSLYIFEESLSLYSLFLGFRLWLWWWLVWLLWLVVILGTISATLIGMIILMTANYRKISLRYLCNIFRNSNPIDFLLEKKMAVCKDYAKLTACLLFNIYPETEIYFVHATGHVATGIMVGENLYVLDKYLPVATFDKWHKLWHKCKFSDKKVEKVKDIYMESVPLNSLLPKTNSSELDTDKLAKLAYELERLLSIQRSKDNSNKNPLEIWHWKNGAILYKDDEIVNYSIAQRLKKIISNEILDINRVAKLRIDLNKNDLIFQIEFK
jgi:predicted transglutaminase-like protease